MRERFDTAAAKANTTTSEALAADGALGKRLKEAALAAGIPLSEIVGVATPVQQSNGKRKKKKCQQSADEEQCSIASSRRKRKKRGATQQDAEGPACVDQGDGGVSAAHDLEAQPPEASGAEGDGGGADGEACEEGDEDGEAVANQPSHGTAADGECDNADNDDDPDDDDEDSAPPPPQALPTAIHGVALNGGGALPALLDKPSCGQDARSVNVGTSGCSSLQMSRAASADSGLSEGLDGEPLCEAELKGLPSRAEQTQQTSLESDQKHKEAMRKRKKHSFSSLRA